MKKHKSIFFAALTLSLFFIVQCSSRNNYKTLNFFFDGVPDPDKAQADTKPVAIASNDSVFEAAAKPKAAKKFFHPPYQERQCEKCHDQSSMGKFIKPQPDLCYSCHENFANKYAFVHGPVSAGYCTACHEPHLSENKDLLARSEEKLCYKCHDASLISQNKSHEGINTAACTDCHNPHGGKDHYMSN
mgnify:CR=1 FL=1